MASNQASSSYTALTSSNHVGGARGSLAQGLGIGLGRTFSHAGTTSAASPASVSGAPSASSSAIRKWQKRRSGDTVSVAGSQSNASASAPVALPASLKAVLEVLSDGLVEGHALLSEALKARYEEQWPLVRSLADVFLAHAYILRHYAEYVCHMERALDQLEEAVELEKAMRGKKVKKDEQLKNTIYLGRMVAVSCCLIGDKAAVASCSSYALRSEPPGARSSGI